MKAYLLLLFFSTFLCHASFFNNSGNWKTVETSYFYIHYKNDTENLIPLVTKYAHEAHLKITPTFFYDPVKEMKQKTHIVLVSTYDSANGAATVLPQNTIYLYLRMPEEGSVLEYNNEFLKSIIFHEYTHIVTISTKRGYADILSSLFGNLFSPNILQPLWLLEGYTVWAESKLTGIEKSGRLNSSLTNMIFRSATCENKIPSLDKWPYALPIWPSGNTPYLYGGAIVEELSEQEGKTAPGKFNYTMSGTIPYFINTALKNSFPNKPKHTFYKLYSNVVKKHKKRYLSQCKLIEKKTITNSKLLTKNGFYKIAIETSPRGIFWAENSPDTGNGIYFIDEKSNKQKLSSSSVSGRSISEHGGNIIFSAIDGDTSSNYFSQLNILNISSKKSKLLSIKGKNGILRIRDPNFNAPGDKIVAVLLAPYQNELILLKLKNSETFSIQSSADDIKLTRITSFPKGIRIGRPSFSPQGNKILFSLKQTSYSQIYTYDLDKNELLQHTFDKSSHIHPSWLNSKNILYSSDKTGVYNLHSLNLRTKKEEILSNFTGGAFQAKKINNYLYCFTYSSNGYDLAKITMPIQTRETFFQQEAKIISFNKEKSNEPKISSKKYNSIKHMTPKSWLPLFSYLNSKEYQLGLFTFGSDPLLRTIYLFMPFYDSQKENLLYEAIISNNQFYPTYTLYLSNNYYSYSSKYTRRKVSLDILFPITDPSETDDIINNTQTGITIGGNWVDDKRLLKTNHLKLGYRRNTSSTYAKSITYEKGSYLEFQYKLFNEKIDSSFNAHILQVKGKKYFSPFAHFVYAPSIHAGWMSEKIHYFFLGGSENTLISTIGLLPHLKGYSNDSIAAQSYWGSNHELYIPIAYIYKGFGTLPLFFKNLSTVFSYDSSFVKKVQEKTNFYHSVSLALLTRLYLGYIFPLQLKLECSRGLQNGGISSFEISLGSTF